MFNFQDIESRLSTDVQITGDPFRIRFDKARTFAEADDLSLVWFKSEKQEEVGHLVETKAQTVVCSNKLNIPADLLAYKCFIQCDSPKLLFSHLVGSLFTSGQARGIHSTAVISPEAVIGEGTSIGANTVIDRCTIGENCVIGSNCHLKDNTEVGNDVIIGSSTVIGGNGFGYSREVDGKLVLFPHLGGVSLGDKVEVGSNTSIDRGALGNTVIHNGVKIDNLVHIAHNVIIGKDALIIAHAMIGGSTQIGERTWITPSACLKNGITIGNDVTVGLGAVVTKNIPDGETWVGNPAMPLREFQAMRKKGIV